MIFFWYCMDTLICIEPHSTISVQSVMPRNIRDVYCLIFNSKGYEIVEVDIDTISLSKTA